MGVPDHDELVPLGTVLCPPGVAALLLPLSPP